MRPFHLLFAVLIIAALAATIERVSANGGTFEISTLLSSGNLIPIQKTKIILEREILKVRIDEDFSEVEVIYHLKNKGGADEVAYAFPVDMPEGAVPGKASDFTFTIKDSSHEQPLPIEQIFGKEPPKVPDTTAGYSDQPMRVWNVTKLSFSKGETKILQINYRARNIGQLTGTSKESISFKTPKKFFYCLSPSQTWGVGQVDKLDISIDVTPLQKQGIPVGEVSPGGYTLQDGVYKWSFEKYPLKNAPDIVVQYDDPKRQRAADIKSNALPKSVIASLEVSSTRRGSKTTSATYGKENLIDGDLSTAWMEGVDGPGVGEWIEVKFKKGTLIRFIALANGYWKGREQLNENGFSKKLRIQCLYTDPNLNDEFSYQLRPPKLDQDYPFSEMAIIVDVGDGPAKAIKSIRITIEEAEPGAKYADTAISELIFSGEIEKKK